MSLIEAKKQQWAKEREEMSRFYVPWGADTQTNRHRDQFASTLELRRQPSCDYQDGALRQRSPSLPPINSSADYCPRDGRELNRNVGVEKRYSFYDEDGEGDTSGYASDTVNLKRQRAGASDRHDPVVAWQTSMADSSRPNNGSDRSTPPEHGHWSTLSSRHGGGGGGAEEGRLRWGDRGVATGRLWEPQDPSCRLPQMQIHKKGTPSWVERGLNMLDSSAEVLVVDQQSNHSGGLECDRLSCNGSDGGRNTFLRGQNVPIEPEIKAQRESKRIKALELQNAIMSQLEEREKKKREERERKLQEERLEELRIQRQREEDERRLSEERRKNDEKREADQRKMEALRKAIQDAENKAKLEKEQLFSIHKPQREIPYDNDPAAQTFILDNNLDKNRNTESKKNGSVQNSPRKPFSNISYDINSSLSHETINKDSSKTNSNLHTPRSASTGNVNLYLRTLPSVALSDAQVGILPIGITPDLISHNVNTGNGIQLAVLVPQNGNNFYQLSQPLSLQSLNSLVNIDETVQTGKLLTPRKYRNFKSKDAWTQTDSQKQSKSSLNSDDQDKNTHNIDKDYQNIDENAPRDGHKGKKDRRFRSEERYKKEIENRPKWGVNRPVAQYKKQSEKDPFYSQKRKFRQKYRPQQRQYLSQSSDESRSPSPPTQSETITETKSRLSLSQSHWRTKRLSQDIFRPSSMNVETVNITPLEFNHLGQVTMGDEISQDHSLSCKSSPNKRITLSQKFINDKYGNRKLWNDKPTTDKNYKVSVLDIETNRRDKNSSYNNFDTPERDTSGNRSDREQLLLHRALQN